MSDTALPFGSIRKTREQRSMDHGRMVAAANARRAVIALAARLDHGRGPMAVDAPMVAFDTGRGHFPAAYVDEMRGWLADCEWGNMLPEDFDELPGRVVLYGVDRTYDGGLSGFMADLRP